MKHIILILLCALTFSCQQKQKETTIQNTVSKEVKTTPNFDWLLGEWKRLNNEEGKQTFENWHKASDTEYIGIGYTMKANDTTFKEDMKITKTDNLWGLSVKTPGNPEAVAFKITTHNSNEFVFINNEIDFPNKIRYLQNGEFINATVSNAEMNIEFKFQKLNP